MDEHRNNEKSKSALEKTMEFIFGTIIGLFVDVTSISYLFGIRGSFEITSVVILIIVITAIIVRLCFKINREFVGWGLIIFLLSPFLLVGGCVSILSILK